MDDIVIGAIGGYEFHQIKNWVYSLNQTAFDSQKHFLFLFLSGLLFRSRFLKRGLLNLNIVSYTLFFSSLRKKIILCKNRKSTSFFGRCFLNTMKSYQLFKLLCSNAYYPSIIPAIVAENNEAIVPPINAFIPNSDKVFRCPGAKDPIPPI